MKNPIKIITTLITTAALTMGIGAGVAYAKGGEKRQPDFQRLAEKLELSEAQTISFVEIMQTQFEKRKALRETARAEGKDRAERKAMKEAHKQETLESLSSILSEEQLANVEKMMKRHKKYGKGKGHKRGDSSQGENNTQGTQS